MSAWFSEWQLAWPWLLALLPLPLLVRWLLPARSDAQADALRVPFAAQLRALSAQQRSTAGWRWPWLGLLIWACLCVAAARPQQLGEVSQPPQTGRDLLLAVDLSGSMQERDMQLGGRWVDRLTAVKAVLGDFLDRRIGDRVGLLLFGQKAYAVTPLTLDRNAVRGQLDDSAVGIAGQETAIGEAIALGVKRISAMTELDADKGQRVLILLTDGVNTAGEIQPAKAAELAQAAGVRVHTIGFGSDGGRGGGLLGMRQPQIDERTLASIAERTGGRYFRARDTRELAGIYAELDRIEPAAREGEIQRPTIERYALPLQLAALGALLGWALAIWRSSGERSA